MEKINDTKILPVATILDGSPACATCPYFSLREDLQENMQTRGAGECRRYPPNVFFNQVMTAQPTGRILPDRTAETVPVIGYNMQMQSPLVKNDFFCGEHPDLRAAAQFDEGGARMDAFYEKLPEFQATLRAMMAATSMSVAPASKPN